MSEACWLDGLSAADERGVRELLAAARLRDGVGPTADQEFSPSARYLVVRDEDGTVVGIAWAAGADPAELVVHPAHRRNGVGTALVTAVLPAGNGIWAHGNLPGAQALADRLSLSSTREMYQLRRRLPAESALVQLPDGVRLRTFVPDQDEEQFLGVNARAFDWHPEQGRLDLAGLRAEMAQDWFDPEGFFLAVDADDRVLGFHWTKVHPTDPTPHDGPAGPVGEVYVLGVDPLSPVRRLGRPLTIAGLDHLHGRGLSVVLLYVESDNEAALRLYRDLGFQHAHSDVVYR